MEPPAKRSKRDAPKEEDLRRMFDILAKDPEAIDPHTARVMHTAGMCEHLDIPNCPLCHIVCAMCHKRKNNPLRISRSRTLGGVSDICIDCAHDVIYGLEVKCFGELWKWTCETKTEDWNPDFATRERVGEYELDKERGRMYAELAKAMSKASPGVFYVLEERVSVAKTSNV